MGTERTTNTTVILKAQMLIKILHNYFRICSKSFLKEIFDRSL